MRIYKRHCRRYTIVVYWSAAVPAYLDLMILLKEVFLKGP